MFWGYLIVRDKNGNLLIHDSYILKNFSGLELGVWSEEL
jgi:hypothetical protein